MQQAFDMIRGFGNLRHRHGKRLAGSQRQTGRDSYSNGDRVSLQLRWVPRVDTKMRGVILCCA